MLPESISINTKALFLSIVCALCFFYIFSVKPPFSSPDEGNHISRSSALLHGEILLHQEGGQGSSGGTIDNSIDQYAVWFGELMRSKDPKEVNKRIQLMKELQFNDISYFHPMPNVAFYFPAIYVPQAASLFIGKVAGLSVYQTYMLMNAVTFALVLLMLWAANKIYAIPLPVYAVLVAPMAMFQMMSPTIDGLTIGLTVLSLSIFMALLNSKLEESKIAMTVFMSFCIFLVASSRANLIPLTLMPLLLFWKKRDRIFLFAFASTFLLSALWTVYNIASVKDVSMTNHVGVSNLQVMVHYVTHPLETVRVVINTITSGIYIDSYRGGLFGSVAWQDAPVSQHAYNGFQYILLLALIFFLRPSYIKNNKATALFTLSIFLLTVILIFLALLIQWSPFPTNEIIGVQGRYFIIPLIILAYSLYGEGEHKTWTKVAILVVSLLSVYSVHEALLQRYFF